MQPSSSDAPNPFAPPKAQVADKRSVTQVPDGVNPWRDIWFKPRITVRSVVDSDPGRGVLLLTALAGIVQAFDNTSGQSLGDHIPLVAILAIIVLAGPLLGLFSLFVGAFLVRWTGQWLDGRADGPEIRAAIAWAWAPMLGSLAVVAVQFAVFGQEMFTTEMPRLVATPQLWIVFGATTVAQFVFGMWSFVLMCNTVAEVQQFGSAWRGFLNLFLASLVVIVPILAVLAVIVVFALMS